MSLLSIFQEGFRRPPFLKYPLSNVLCESISFRLIGIMLMMGTMSVRKHYLLQHIDIFDIFWITPTGDFGEMYTMPSCSLSLLSLLLASMCTWPTRLVQVSKGAGCAPLHCTRRHILKPLLTSWSSSFGWTKERLWPTEKAVGRGFQNNDEFRIKGGYTNVPHLS